MCEADEAAEGPSTSPRGEADNWMKAWQWKREHRPDRDRFRRPYIHELRAGSAPVSLTIHQAKFAAEGFASTVWDSSIVLAKYLERWAARYRGARCLELSAGCGLPGCVLAALGARVTASDLGPNLPLLRRNYEDNGLAADIVEHRWGEDVAALGPPFDAVLAADVMYIPEAASALLATLRDCAGPGTQVLLAHGRNRCAEPAFVEAAARCFAVRRLRGRELHPHFQCADVDVLQLTRLPAGAQVC